MHALKFPTLVYNTFVISGGRVIPTKLQAVAVPIISDDACRKAYGEAIVGSMMCAGYEEGMRDSCQVRRYKHI